MRRGDENIFPEEVERVLNFRPQVAESAVIAVADLIRGEEVKAYIMLKSVRRRKACQRKATLLRALIESLTVMPLENKS